MNGPRTWGARPEECARELPCDALLPAARERLHRAVSVAAPVMMRRQLLNLRALAERDAGPAPLSARSGAPS